MDRSPVLFRCDGNSASGWEAFYQCLTYAAALQRRRRPCYFLGEYGPLPLFAAISRGGNEFITSDHPLGSPEDSDATLRQIRKIGAASVVVAGTGVSVEYFRELSASGVMVAAMDTEASVRFPTRLVINPLLGPEKRAYQWERGTQLLLGGRYAIVRSVFRRQRQVRVLEPQPPYRGILAFGDDDFAGQSLLRAKELLAASRVDKLSVIVRSHHHQWDELKELASSSGGRMELLGETHDLSTRLPRAHFVVTSGDSWSLEMACVGVPQLVISQNPRQALNGKLLDGEGAANYLGDASSVTNMQLRDGIANLLDDQLERMGMSRCGRQLIDGRGPDRIVNALEIMVRANSGHESERIAA